MCEWGCEQGCVTYGAHLRNKGIRYNGVFETRTRGKGYGFGSAAAERKNEKELDYYERLRDQGVQPAGTTWNKCEEADRKSQATGQAYDAANPYKHVDLRQFEED